MKQRIALLGSTGSIGEQTLDIIRENPDRFEAVTLTAGSRWQSLARQAREFIPDSVVIADREHYAALSEALADLPVKVYAGSEAVEQVAAAGNIDTVVNALVGYAGLPPTMRALEAGHKLVLANKESLVIAGETVMRTAAEHRAPLLPVDSEHSAVFQCLAGETSPIHRIILTASGGPFRTWPAERLAEATVEQTLQHPNWSMGARITVDSATMVNKGFEVIEARWLFGVEPSQIEVTVHPQSVVHSMVEFCDGAVKAQIGTPDMHLPISYALTFPQRLDTPRPRFSFADNRDWTFEPVDRAKFPALDIAYDCLRRGGTAACTMNAADETAVAAFLRGEIRFTDIVRTIEKSLAGAAFTARPTLDDYRAADTEARRIASEIIRTL